MKSLYRFLLIPVLVLSVSACFNKKKPNYRYMNETDMYTSPSYETYSEHSIFPGNQEAQAPAENTISRGWVPYEFPDTNDGKQAAADSLENPLPYTERNADQGEHVFNIYCAICHGEDGGGDGPLAEREKMMGIPAFDDPGRDITEGDVYHVIYYGLNNMGSYAAQTTHKERWQIVQHVMDLKDELEGNEKREFEEDTTENKDHFDKEIDPLIGRQVINLR